MNKTFYQSAILVLLCVPLQFLAMQNVQECKRFDEEGLFIFAPLNHYVLHARIENKKESILLSIRSPNKAWAHSDLQKKLTKGYHLIKIISEEQTGPLVSEEYLKQSIKLESKLEFLENENLYFKLLPDTILNKIAGYLLSVHNLK